MTISLISVIPTSVSPEYDRPRPDRLISGNPLRTTWGSYESAGMSAGIWACEKGAWQIAFADDKNEFFCVIEGKIKITDANGHSKEFGPGDGCVIPSGFTGTFEVLEPVKKYYVIAESS